MIVQEEDRQRFIEYRQQVIADPGLKADIVIGFCAKSGETVFAEGVVSPKYLEGKPLYTRGIFRDVTRRLRNEARLQSLLGELEEREENLQKLLTFAPDAIIVIDADSKVKYWNPKAEQIFGWPVSAVLGKLLTDLIIPPQFREAHLQGMQRLLETGKSNVLNKTYNFLCN